MDDEANKILDRYTRRHLASDATVNSNNYLFDYFAQSERELVYLQTLKQKYSNFKSVRFIEVGAGHGINLYFFQKAGLKDSNIYANELIPDRVTVLKENFPSINIYEGDACLLKPMDDNYFDIVFQSTVFSSILDFEFKKKLANKMWSLLKSGGFILWYDFIYNNPKNPDVKGVPKSEIFTLFPKSSRIIFRKVTLAPPLGRKISSLYPFFNVFPFLRTHVVAIIEKP